MAPIAPRFMELSEIEARAEDVLRDARCRGLWDGAWPVPIDAIAEILFELTIEFDDLAERFGASEALGEGALLGAIDFGEMRVWIDQSLDPDQFPKRRARYHFTLAHEVAHWVLHASLYGFGSGQTRLGTEAPQSALRCRGLDQASRSHIRRDPREFQANAFAGYLMLPRENVLQLWRASRARPFERELVQASQMSQDAVSIRLRELGLQAPAPSVGQRDLFRAA